MDFSLDRFYRLNRRLIIWLILLALLYLLRDFLLLIFLTFIIGFFAYPVAHFLMDRLHMGRRFAVTLVYAGILVGFVGTVWWITPNLIGEATKLNLQIPTLKKNLNALRIEYSEEYPPLAGLVESLLSDEDEIRPRQPVGTEETQELLLMILERLSEQRGEELVGANGAAVTVADVEADEDELDAEIARVETGEAVGPAETDAETTAQARTGPGTRRPGGPVLPLEAGADEVAAAPEAAELPVAVEAEIAGGEDEAEEMAVAEAGEPAAGAEDALAEAEAEALEDEEALAAAGALGEDVGPNVYDPSEPSYIDRQIDVLSRQLARGLAAGSARLGQFILQALLAILFSYLIVLDLGRLTKELSTLRSSNLRDFYEEAGQPVVNFALAVGRGFQAIAVIAFITALMMAVVFLIFDVPQKVLLSVIVFVTSLVPIVGVVFEALAVMLVTFNEYGLTFRFWAVAVGLVIVHMIIAYAIAPVIFGRQFRLNMVLVLIVLYLGQQIAGMWGLILAVPVANYFIRDVFAVPFIEEREAATRKRRGIEIQPDETAEQPQPPG